jgi:hypothetical protein
VLVILIRHCLSMYCMCVDFVREQFDLFIMLSVVRLKHAYVRMRATSIILYV